MGIYIRQKVLRQMHVLKTFAPARQTWQGMPSQSGDGMEKRESPKKDTACQCIQGYLRHLLKCSVLEKQRELRVRDKERKMRFKSKKINKKIKIQKVLRPREREKRMIVHHCLLMRYSLIKLPTLQDQVNQAENPPLLLSNYRPHKSCKFSEYFFLILKIIIGMNIPH